MNIENTGISFENNLPYTEEFNTYTYRNFYNGGGVALGDINNDGLVDIYFTGNIVDNKLYLNKGDWHFEDVTEKTGLACANVWCTGASMVDVNGDGLLDIYVCKAGKPGGEKRHNELFINEGNLKFDEQSKAYGLDIEGMSIHSAFFDYDRDGDLDCYLLNNSIRSVGGFDLQEGLRDIPDPQGNKFFEQVDGRFVEVTQKAGFYSSNIGYGLGITLSDFNEDGWTDVFISNDFFERDYLYLNNQDKTFSEVGALSMSSMSMGSMGADACDIDNDLKPDLFVTEMLPKSLERKKTKTQYETWDKYSENIKKGYHHQFSRNALHRNMGNNTFFEIGRMAGVDATEWSWASLIQDFDNDGLKDIFISNGIYKDLLDKDYLNYFASDAIIKSKIDLNEDVITKLVDEMPSQPMTNYMYRNKGNFSFENVSEEWGLGEPTFSNGSAYADLDNDGDLDLVVNNANMPASIYQNTLDTSLNKSIQIHLTGSDKNRFAIGSKVYIKHNDGQAMIENYTSKGFQSTVDHHMHIGVGNADIVDSLKIIWPNGLISETTNLKTNTSYTFDQKEAKKIPPAIIESNQEAQNSLISFTHQSSKLNQFSRERLLINMNGQKGPGIAVEDLNNDGKMDIFCGGGKNQSSVLYLSGDNGYSENNDPFQPSAKSESVAARFFDSDNDGDMDLYVAHGGPSFSIYAQELNDELYINEGNGIFVLHPKALNFPHPIHTSQVSIGDLNQDGYNDIVVAERMKNNLFGIKAGCFVLLNNGDNTYTHQQLKHLEEIGMVSGLRLADIDRDEDLDIIMAGKWMPITIVENKDGFENSVPEKIPSTSGLWETIEIEDLDKDGDLDIIGGNVGLNNYYEKGMVMFVNDFDQNGSAEQVVCQNIEGKFYPIHDIDEMYKQMPPLKKKFKLYADFAKASIDEMFGEEAVNNSIKYELDELRSLCLLNDGDSFKKLAFPSEMQYSSINDLHVRQIVDKTSIYSGGNTYQIKPQFGRQDASLGWKLDLVQNEGSITFLPCQTLNINGQIRSIASYGNHLIFGINGEKLKIVEVENE